MSERLPPQLVKTLSARSDARGLARLGGHLAAIAAAATLVLAARDTAWVWPAMALLGLFEVALFAPLHETTHRTPFRSPWLNSLVGRGAGFLLVLPPEWFRLFHMAHHRHTGDPSRDPELIGAKPLTRARYLLVLTGLPYWAGNVRAIMASARGRVDVSWIPSASRRTVVREARLYLTLYAIVAAIVVGGSPLPLLLWVLPVLLGQPVLRAVLLAEHAGCPLIPDRFRNTRTTLAARPFAWLFWNANLHAEHHLAPGVPFHALPRLHAAVRGRLEVLEPSYPTAHRAILAELA